MKTPVSTQSIVVRFAGDSGDGVQLLGSQFADSTALAGADFSTFPDFPAEIRAPVGTTFGVSAFQINLGSRRIATAGDAPDVLVAFNPAALKVNLSKLPKGALVILNTDEFNERNFSKADIKADARTTGELADYRVIEIPIRTQTLEAVKDSGLGKRDAEQCKNFWALGAILWMFGRDRTTIENWIGRKFAKSPEVLAGNMMALRAGHAYAETAELSAEIPQFEIGAAPFPHGDYRSITGAEALALGLAAAGELADRQIIFCSYPITPASPILHHLSRLGELGVATFQAEDEIAACCAAIGASFGGAIGVTSSSGPGIALKTEAIGLAIATELPLVVVNSQRGGPSTGLPTKTEQSDLYQAIYGRNGDAQVPVIAASSPGDCFEAAIEATRAALRHMTPVFLLTDGYIANASGPWAIPDISKYEPIKSNSPSAPQGADAGAVKRAIWSRNKETFGRPWIAPGMKGFAHRVGGLEKDIATGDISYDDDNHQKMSELRAAKVASVAKFIPPQTLEQGPQSGPLIVVGWGSTHGVIWRAVNQAIALGLNVAQAHLRWLNPLPDNLGALLAGYDRVLLPEMNMGQCATLLRDRLEISVIPLDKVSGQPFKISEILDAIRTNYPSAAEAAE